MSQTAEKSKVKQYSINSIVKMMDKHTIRFDHPSQREADQWSIKMKGNLISDIIQGNPIPAVVMAEQIVNGVSITWNLDGKQRCSNVYSYVHNGFKIPKGIRRPVIKYQTMKKDKNGNQILDENGFPIAEMAEFNITNKTFSQLPEELQDAINWYCFDVVLYLNCSDEDIIYHIDRYNDGRPMNKSQKGVIKFSRDYAERIKDLSNHSFFVDCGTYGKNAKNSGAIDRIVFETIMATEFINDWNSNQEKICSHINKNATEDIFENLEDTLDRLEEIVDGSTDNLFTMKDSFIWFVTFNKFKKFGLNDDYFAEFMEKFNDELINKEIDGVSYKQLEGNSSTKNKAIVMKKLTHIKKLLDDFINEKKTNTAA